MLTNRFTNVKNAAVVMLLLMSALLVTVPSALADDAPAKSSGILPLPDYSGDFFTRSYLLGDLGGKRTEWAKKGFTFDIDYNQYFQAVTDGGTDTGSGYGGTIDYYINIDFDRMGLIPGGLFQMRAVSRYGNSVNGIGGSIIPVNSDAAHPTTSTLDDDVALWLPAINYTQFLSEKFAMALGKFDTSDNANEFAGGRGRSQWWNANLNNQVSPVLITPYSLLGASAVIMPSPDLTITFLVGTITDTSNRSGFHDLDDGMFGVLRIDDQYQIHGLPGGFSIISGYGWDRDFTEIKGRMNIEAGQLKPTTKDDTWCFSTEAWQYLWTEEAAKQSVDLNDGRQDLQGVGIFSRYQLADKDTNPLEYCISAGVSAKGLIPRRDNDAMGIAFNYNKFRDGRLLDLFDTQSTVWECFYNIELTPAMHWTLDLQVADGALPNTDRATILGTSLQIRF